MMQSKMKLPKAPSGRFGKGCLGALAILGAVTSFAANSPFVEENFPILSACISGSKGKANVAYKGVAIKLDHDAAVLFDKDLLRIAEGWTGDFLNVKGVTFDGSHGGHSSIDGESVFDTRMVPGWLGEGMVFNDPRTEPFGPVPKTLGSYDGYYISGDQVGLTYTVMGSSILEQPAAVNHNGATAIVRSFKVSGTSERLQLMLADLAGADVQACSDSIVASHDGDVTTAIRVVGAPSGSEVAMVSDGLATLQLPVHAGEFEFRVVIWKGASADLNKFQELLFWMPTGKPAIADFYAGGTKHWTESVVTEGELATEEEGAYVVDRLTSPVDNPWNRRIRFGGMDFFSNGTSAALSTWDGDIWIVEGINQSLDKLTWTRFASGLYEPLGLVIVNDTIYVSGRDGITRFYDYNQDGEADFYECFNNDITSTDGFHEFVFDLQTDNEGYFYTAKAAPVRPGGRGFETISANAGTVMRISPDGSMLENYATGLRAPNGIGVSPEGQVTTGDNEGTWMPACPLNWVEKYGFYGVEDTAHRTPVPKFNLPLCWLSHKEYDNSGGGQVWVTSDRWGPLKGELLHMSYGKSSMYLVLKDKVGDQMQGGVVKLPLNFTSSAMRARFSPLDGQLYVAGLRGWQTNAANITGFDRIRYTGKPFLSVTGLKVNSDGIHLTFSTPIDREEAANPDNYAAEQWNYNRSSNYGSPEFSVSAPEERGRDEVSITGATVSEDGKTVTLQVADLKPVMQMKINFSLLTEDGDILEQNLLHTIHKVPGA